MNFASDNAYGVHPKIMAALAEANSGTAPGYGSDSFTRRAEEKMAETFGCDLRCYLVTNGTAANGLSLSAITPGFGAILTHAESHIACDECNSPELFTGGAKIIGLPAFGGKITPPQAEAMLATFIRGEHDPKPKGISLTNATELGTVYSPDEVRAFSALARGRRMKLHIDGARIANAIAAMDVSPAELTWKAGVDVLSFGATKNGAMMVDAVVFFDLDLAEDFAYRRMRAGQLISKSRYLGAQLLAYLEDGLWLDNARRANQLAQRLERGLRSAPDVRIPCPVQANIVFAAMPQALHDKLKAAGAVFFQRYPSDMAAVLKPGEVSVRLVTSCVTPEADIDKLVGLAQNRGGV